MRASAGRSDRGRPETLRSARRACEERLRQLALTSPFDLAALCASVEAMRGRRLRILPKPKEAAGGPCGMVLSTDNEDIVFVERATSAMHASHILLHELGHLVFDHHTIDEPDDSFVRQALPDLDPAAVRWVLARREYVDRQETEAEMFASLLASAAQWRDARPRPEDLPESIREMYAALTR